MAAEREFDLINIDGTNGVVIKGSIGFDDNFGTNYSGYVVKGAGDINGDGFSDIVVSINGLFSLDVKGASVDESYVVFGSDSGFDSNLVLSELEDSDGSQGFVVKGNEALTLSGFSVDAAGDVNGDGIDDFIVGNYTGNLNGDDSGESYVVFGRTTGFGSTLDLESLANSDGSQGFAINGIAAGDRVGWAVSGAGDVNSDGIDDVIITAYTADANGEDSGESYVIFGSASGFDSVLDLSKLDEIGGFSIAGLSADDRLGISVSEAGDVNGDGIADIVIGAYGVDQSYVVFGSADGFGDSVDLASLDGSNGFTISGTGNIVNSAGDVNGDGVGDLALSTGSGQSYVVFGNADGFESLLDLQALDGTNGFAVVGGNAIDGAVADGNAIDGAGDFNGDGFDDVVVSRYREDNDNGRTYVIFGSASGFDETFELSSVDGINGFVINGFAFKGEGGNAGYSVSGAEDFNGDGFDDLLIGTRLPRYDSFDRETRGPDEIYVVFGQPASEGAIALNDDFSTDEDTVFSGNVLANDTSVAPERTDNLSITTVSGVAASVGTQIALDSGALLTLNADGSFDYDPNGSFERLNNNAIYVDSFSYTVTDGVATDTGTASITVNGITDPPTGTPSETTLQLADLDGSDGFAINVEDPLGYSSSYAVSGIGDINGDGFDDAIVANYIVFGSNEGFDSELSSESLDGSDGFTLSGSITNSGGTYDINISSVSGAGDINGDGIDDFVVGDAGLFGFSIPGRSGRSYVVFGNADGFDPELDLATLNGNNGFIVENTYDSDQFGASVSGAGDINGDGIDDLIVGAPFLNPFGGDTGKSFVIFGKNDGFESKLSFSGFGENPLDSSDGFVLKGVDRQRYGGDYAGSSVSGAGDINGDGIDDVIIGAPGGGESYVVFGNSQGFDSTVELVELDGSNGFTIDEKGSGTSVSGAGDINGDGIDDVVVGAQGYNASFVIFGSTEDFDSRFNLSKINGANGFAIEGTNPDQCIGGSVGHAGDVNGDGIDDLIVGSASDSFNNAGPGDSYVIYGSTDPFGSTISVATLDGRDGFVIEGAGRVVSGAGDFNGDGTGDLIIGDRSNAGNISGTGYVVFGESDLPDSPTTPTTNPLNPVSGGTPGNDGITGTRENDALFGLAGNDVLSGQAGEDVLDGGEGTDTALYQFDPAGVVVDLLAGAATDGFGNTDTLVSIENVIGSDFNDAIAGDDNANSLTGREGDDTLEGGLGDDTLLGGNGFDLLSGGGGADSFLYLSATEGGDAIADFETGTDKLLLIGTAFGGLPSGEVSAELFFAGASAMSASQRLGYNADTGEVIFDIDGSGEASAQILATLSNFSRSDVVVL